MRRRKGKAEGMLVVCEGETELQYLLELAFFMGIADKVDIRRTDQYDPGSELETLAKAEAWAEICGADHYAEVWLVFDRDSHAGYRRAVKAAEKLPRFHTVFSRPCIEYWFLLHCADFSGSLPKNGKLVCSREVKTEIGEDGLEIETTVETFERITTPDICYDRLKELVPFYSKTKISFLQYFGARTEKAYKRAKKMAASPYEHGSDMPLLFDRFCEIAGVSPKTVLDALKIGTPLPGGTVSVIPDTVACNLPPDLLSIVGMSELLSREDWDLAEEDWLRIGHALDGFAAWLRRVILRRTGASNQKALAASLGLHLRPIGAISETEMKHHALNMMRMITSVNGRLENMDVSGLKKLFVCLQNLDRGVRQRFLVEGEGNGQ